MEKTYGYDDPNTGRSLYVYAADQGLNEEQTNAVFSRSIPTESEFTEIMKEYSDDFHKGESSYEGADFDYTSISNVETEKSEKGEEETETFETFVEPDASGVVLDQESVKDATTADVMNEDIPTEDRFIYVDKDNLS